METISRRPGKFASAAKVKRETVQETVADAEYGGIPPEANPMRPPMREEDSRAAAAKRAAQLREHLGDVVDGQDDFYIPLDEIPDGWTYEWKRHTLMGQEDPAYQIQLLRAGWEPVPAVRHPWMMPHNTESQTILRKGMILMQCPTDIIDERRLAEQRKARNQVRAKEAQIAGTPDGTMTRDDARVRPQIKKSYEAMPIPEK
jgi:hypothetical protein